MNSIKITKTAVIFAALLSLLLNVDAMAQGKSFDEAVKAGMNHYRARQYGPAIARFEEAYRLNPQPELIYNVARAYEKSVKRDEAIAAYQRFLALKGTTAVLRSKALDAMSALRREKVALQKAMQMEPGPGGVSPGGGGAVTRAPSQASKSHTVEWVLIGGGAAVATVGGAFGLLALQANNDFNDRKADGESRSVLQDKKSTADNNALAADVLIGVGVLSALAGLVLYATGSAEQDVAVTPVFGPDYAAMGIVGRF
jgi:tetratricopeptide (TPR) repeat protein